jgi:hypothetical protein
LDTLYTGGEPDRSHPEADGGGGAGAGDSFEALISLRISLIRDRRVVSRFFCEVWRVVS